MILSMTISPEDLAKSLGAATIGSVRPANKRTARDPQANPLYADIGNSIAGGFANEGDPGAAITRTVPNTNEHLAALRRLVAQAAGDHGVGYRFRVETAGGGHEAHATYWTVELPPDYGTNVCPECNQDVRITSAGNLRTHGPRNNRCGGSGDQAN